MATHKLIIEMRHAAASNVAGNTHSNEDAPPAPSNDKKTAAKAPAHQPPDKTQKQVEGVPPYAKESLSGDGWTKAAEKAKQMFQAKK